MKTRLVGQLAAASIALALAACGSDNIPSAPGVAGGPEPVASTADRLRSGQEPSTDPDLAAEDVPANNSEPTIEAARLGRPFDYVFANDAVTWTWKVTLTKVQCGLKSIPEAENNPKWDGGTEFPQYIAARPAKGKDFCVFFWSWKNVGKVHAKSTASEDIMIGDERHARSQEDEMMSWTVMDTKLGVGYANDVNPGESTKSLDVYQVPAGVTPDSVWFSSASETGSTLLISTK